MAVDRMKTGPRGGCTFLFLGVIAMLVAGTWAALSADLALPNLIVYGRSNPDSMPIGRFGTYSDAYYERRWARMCRGPMRYDAMREAFERGKQNPCAR
jgi:hypothetical protein